VMNCRSAPRYESADRRVLIDRFEQFDKRPAGIETDDSSAVRIGKLHRLHLEHVSAERNEIFERFDGDSDMRDSRALGGSRRH
jgi:hypothetical protein